MPGKLEFLWRWIPGRRALEEENSRLRANLAEAAQRLETWERYFPPGHYYSPLPDQAEIDRAFARGGIGPPFADIDLNEAGQQTRLERFVEHYRTQPFPAEPTAGHRFHLRNPSYGPYDAIMLYAMLAEARPRRVIEVGSGFSSAAMLDADERALGGRTAFTFIDPDPSRLKALLRPGDEARITLVEQMVQDVPLTTFQQLQENDVLFIDSSHVSKVGSDVNWIFFQLLPVLAPGVLIHLHDITGILEYPPDQIMGRAWNEQYLLRAFLMHNRAYRIELFTSWLMNTRKAWFEQHMPLCLEGGGGQLWLRKT
ncbi:MAG TPA: class I SAM-dependent methyltransferase [Opitutaceae bacterium]|nr:class I SAM-dependent methyltransferase [Opitutaceae bacterium]HND62124.1 class I SAM-dependent methyltransferase [Opitutaceae bacterium]